MMRISRSPGQVIALLVAAACSVATLLAPPAALASGDAAAIQAAIQENYAAYSGFDETRYRATTTDDYLLLEHGELIDREGDVASMAKPGTGFRRTDHFDFSHVKVVGDTAYAVYTLRSEIYDDERGERDREWLESAILRREGGRWKVALLHSTRVSHPAGAEGIKQFAVRYSAAWSSQDPARVAAFHAENGSLTINDGPPAIGRTGIAEAARAFMTAYPDMVVELDRLEHVNGKYRYHWRFTGTNSGPGGTGRPVKTVGYEEWTIGPDGLIASSQGHYDAADWDRQLGKAP
jgi:ketosteroid isomerase-like protein